MGKTKGSCGEIARAITWKDEGKYWVLTDNWTFATRVYPCRREEERQLGTALVDCHLIVISYSAILERAFVGLWRGPGYVNISKAFIAGSENELKDWVKKYTEFVFNKMVDDIKQIFVERFENRHDWYDYTKEFSRPICEKAPIGDMGGAPLPSGFKSWDETPQANELKKEVVQEMNYLGPDY